MLPELSHVLVASRATPAAGLAQKMRKERGEGALGHPGWKRQIRRKKNVVSQLGGGAHSGTSDDPRPKLGSTSVLVLFGQLLVHSLQISLHENA